MSVSRLQGVTNARRRAAFSALLCLIGSFFLLAIGASSSRAQDDPPPPTPTYSEYWSVYDSIHDDGDGIVHCIAAGTVYDDWYGAPKNYKVLAQVIVYDLSDTNFQHGTVIYFDKTVLIPHGPPSTANLSYDLHVNLALYGIQPGAYNVRWRGDGVPPNIAPLGGEANTQGWDLITPVTVPYP